jgi:protein involved in polysaccharide export with SLBB domain
MLRRTSAALLTILTLAAPDTRAQPARGDPDATGLTVVERIASERAGVPLTVHGHDRIAAATADPPAYPGTVGDDYAVGVGDVLAVTLRGRRDADVRVAVDGAGMVVIPELRPVPAAGRTLGEVRAALRVEARTRLTETDAFVSLAEARPVVVTVTGEVARPGRKVLGPFAGPLDALAAAGGVLRTGSLRSVTLVRGGTRTRIDLHAFLDGSGDAADRPLRDGDRIVVPAMGPVAAIAGAVGRPGLHELTEAPLTATGLAALAGGVVAGPAPRWTRLGIGSDGRERAEEIATPETTEVRPGDILFVLPGGSGTEGRVSVEGHVRHPGPRARGTTASLASLVRTLAFLPDVHLSFAVLETTDPGTRRRTFLPVDLEAAMAGTDDRPLADDDRLIVLGAPDVRFLSSAAVQRVIDDPSTPPPSGCAGLGALARHLAADGAGPLARGPAAFAARDLTAVDLPCPAVFDRDPDLLPLAIRRSVLLRRGADRPGFHPLASPSGPDGAGPGAVVDVGGVGVMIEGAVRAPGRLPLDSAATLGRLLAAVGGPTSDAYGLMALVERADPASWTRRTIAFVPRSVSDGAADMALVDGDRVVILSEGDVRDAATDEGPPAVGSRPRRWPGHWVTVAGAVTRPGRLPVGGPVPLASLVDAAGGPTPDARTDVVHIATEAGARIVDLARAGGEPVGPGTTVRIALRSASAVPGVVTVDGAVRRPGLYDLAVGDTLADLLDRAGGPGALAHLAGLALSRPGAGGTRRRIVLGSEELADGGRDVWLEAGDAVFVPTLRATVGVEGAVHVPIVLPHVPGKAAERYLAEAGGPTGAADRAAIHVILPDGRALPLASTDDVAIPPGSTIVVPRDPRSPDDPPLVRMLTALLALFGRSAASP